MFSTVCPGCWVYPTGTGWHLMTHTWTHTHTEVGRVCVCLYLRWGSQHPVVCAPESEPTEWHGLWPETGDSTSAGTVSLCPVLTGYLPGWITDCQSDPSLHTLHYTCASWYRGQVLIGWLSRCPRCHRGTGWWQVYNSSVTVATFVQCLFHVCILNLYIHVCIVPYISSPYMYSRYNQCFYIQVFLGAVDWWAESSHVVRGG